jgi:hypothetical protein
VTGLMEAPVGRWLRCLPMHLAARRRHHAWTWPPARHDSACGMYQRSCAVLYSVKGTARNEHRRPRGRGIMHPMSVKLFIETDADDLLAEEEVKRRGARRSRRNRPAVVVKAASRDRNLRPRG